MLESAGMGNMIRKLFNMHMFEGIVQTWVMENDGKVLYTVVRCRKDSYDQQVYCSTKTDHIVLYAGQVHCAVKGLVW